MVVVEVVVSGGVCERDFLGKKSRNSTTKYTPGYVQYIQYKHHTEGDPFPTTILRSSLPTPPPPPPRAEKKKKDVLMILRVGS